MVHTSRAKGIFKTQDHPGWRDMYMEGHHSQGDRRAKETYDPAKGDIDLLELVSCGERQFLPLVRERTALTCGLRIMFLRKENPGRVYQGGDLDNRLKTLFARFVCRHIRSM